MENISEKLKHIVSNLLDVTLAPLPENLVDDLLYDSLNESFFDFLDNSLYDGLTISLWVSLIDENSYAKFI